jgi:hypothetical protein
MNRYAYVLGNQIINTDPSGHRVCDGPGLECEGHPLLGCVDGYCSESPTPLDFIPLLSIYSCTSSGGGECISKGDNPDIMIALQ